MTWTSKTGLQVQNNGNHVQVYWSPLPGLVVGDSSHLLIRLDRISEF